MHSPISGVRLADECWVALALLHRETHDRSSFLPREILDRLGREFGAVRPGAQPHISKHNVANLPPDPARYRLFYRMPDGSYRLYRRGDPAHPNRNGKMAPRREDLPVQYHGLLDWYEREYSRAGATRPGEDDPVLGMLGVGAAYWAGAGGGDAYLHSEREDWDSPEQPAPAPTETASIKAVWRQVVQHAGETFHTVRGLPFTYRIDGNGFWIEREGREIHRLTRAELEVACERRPLPSTTALQDLHGPSYLFALLNDSRICPAEG
jgi:hypothetical protein